WYASNSRTQGQPNEADQPNNPFTGLPPKDSQIAAGASGTQRFSDIKAHNVDMQTWRTTESAFRDGRGTAPEWFRHYVPAGTAPNNWSAAVTQQIPQDTLGSIFQDAGAYAFWNAYKPDGVLHIIRERFAGLPD